MWSAAAFGIDTQTAGLKRRADEAGLPIKKSKDKPKGNKIVQGASKIPHRMWRTLASRRNQIHFGK